MMPVEAPAPRAPAGWLTTVSTGRVARTQEPTQLKSSQLNSCPPCLRTMYRQSAVRKLPRRDLHETESPPWCGARAAVASLPDCGHGPGRSRSGLAPFFFFSRVRRGPTRGLKAKTDRVSTRSSARRPHSVRTPTTIRSSHRWLTAVPQAVQRTATPSTCLSVAWETITCQRSMISWYDGGIMGFPHGSMKIIRRV